MRGLDARLKPWLTTEQAVSGPHSRAANGLCSTACQSESSADVRLFVPLAETTSEDGFLQRIHMLHLMQSHLPLFVMPSYWRA
jgi:hypothetical protein